MAGEALQIKDAVEYPLISAACIFHYCELMDDLGVDGEGLLRRYGMHPELIKLPNAQVRYDSLVALFAESARITQRTDFGLLLGQKMPVESLDLVLLSSQEPTLKEALACMDKYSILMGQGFSLELEVSAEEACWKFYHDVYLDADMSQMSDLAVYAMLAILRFMLGDKLDVSSVILDCAAPKNNEKSHQCFSAHCEFGHDYVGIKFPAGLLKSSLSGNQRLKDIILRYAEENLASKEGGLVAKVAHLVNVLLPTGRCCIENIADLLGLHRRTLQKKLSENGVAFKDILQEKRQDKACYLLTNTDLGLQDIASSLGYSDTANFLHAFKRWMGDTPIRWRKSSLIS